jgi:acetyl-CoA carboxylase biotin carboxyl carrier protein
VTSGESTAEHLVEVLGAQAKRLAAEVPGGLRRVSVRAGEAVVEMEWAAALTDAGNGDGNGNGNGNVNGNGNGNGNVPAAGGDTSAVVSPLVGTFYHAPEPGSPPFVGVGDVVGEDTVVGIVEAMKMMNKVRAGRSGTVAAVLATDGELVEYGQPLVELTAGW